jgi:hypothetical protein
MNFHLQEIETLSNSLRKREKHVTELENRLRALRDKYDAELKHCVQMIGRLENAGNEMYKFINPPSPCMRTTIMDNLLQGWDDAKININ